MTFFVHLDIQGRGTKTQNVSLTIANFIDADVDCTDTNLLPTEIPGLFKSACCHLSQNSTIVWVRLMKALVKHGARLLGKFPICFHNWRERFPAVVMFAQDKFNGPLAFMKWCFNQTLDAELFQAAVASSWYCSLQVGGVQPTISQGLRRWLNEAVRLQLRLSLPWLK